MQKTSTVAKIWYDGLGRRVVKQIGDDCETTHEVGDWDGAYHYYYDGHKLIETRNASYRVLKQYVWGTQYIDELLEIGVNHDPTDTDETNGGGCEVFFWALHDANYNVIGLVNPFSLTRELVERYEYTPYGQRTVYSRGWLLADVNEDGEVTQADLTMAEGESGVNSRCDVDGDGDVDGDDEDAIEDAIGQSLNDAGDKHPTFYSSRGKDEDGCAPYLTVGLCDVGHQGLFYDIEFGCYYNRGRTYHPSLMRFLQHDPLGYIDSMNLFESYCSNPVTGLDPEGTQVNNVQIDQSLSWGQNYDVDVIEEYAAGKITGKASVNDYADEDEILDHVAELGKQDVWGYLGHGAYVMVNGKPKGVGLEEHDSVTRIFLGIIPVLTCGNDPVLVDALNKAMDKTPEDNPGLVILMGCYTTDLTQDFLSRGTRCVIGYNTGVDDDSAKFLKRFFDHWLKRGKSLQDAFVDAIKPPEQTMATVREASMLAGGGPVKWRDDQEHLVLGNFTITCPNVGDRTKTAADW